MTGSEEELPDDVLKEMTAWEYQTYASGRQNVAFLDIKVILKRRMNPLMGYAEEITGLFIDSVKPKKERMEAVLYTFDGNEKNFVPPRVPGSDEIEKAKSPGNSSYDGFVFAIVNKMQMRKLRDERYDASLTFTKDNSKLPDWATVMSESAEVTETMLTKDVIAAVNAAGDMLEYLIISDQPTDKPSTLDETTPKKRIHISLRLPSDGNYASTLPIFQAFLRMPDLLVGSAHFRTEVMRKIKATRDSEKAKLKKVSDQEAEEERREQLDKMKKEEKGSEDEGDECGGTAEVFGTGGGEDEEETGEEDESKGVGQTSGELYVCKVAYLGTVGGGEEIGFLINLSFCSEVAV